ncbi:hypothetical protein IFM89_024492 [Coptis chinensis]|uniref:PSP proline-rich domain-containing protein n=1 Tax=Coptis chinensis TaxID=261450 RepID=A0A835H546_9MAGN|nr:hypothetical protein IFM89_024492 [Coptis chinensis]
MLLLTTLVKSTNPNVTRLLVLVAHPRYYQSSHGGKYDEIRPGVLSSETRQLLGLGELDPPPWLRSMHEIGYPPGYLDTGNYSDPRRSREYRDDGPPGCNLGFDTPRYGGYSPTYASDSYSPRGYPIPRSTDRGRWNPLVHDDSPSYSPKSLVTHASPNTLQSPQSFSSANSESRSDSSHHNSSSDFSSRRNDRQDHHRHRRK